MRSKPFSQWPLRDQERWKRALNPAEHDPFGPEHPNWREGTWRQVRRAYGGWLQWLDDQGILDTDRSPSDRADKERILRFVEEERVRLNPQTLSRSLRALAQAIRRLEPEADMDWLRPLQCKLDRRAQFQRRTPITPCLAEPLYQLGISLMSAFPASNAEFQDLVDFRDGLIIAMLALMPVRVGQFASLDVALHVAETVSGMIVTWPAEATKANRVDRWTLPLDFTPWVRFYISVVREALLARRRGKIENRTRFWIGTSGRPIGHQVIRHIIARRTKIHLGCHVRPHDFRRAAATSYVLAEPARAIEAGAVLGHRDFRVTERHYIAGRHIRAQESYLKALQAKRSVAGRRQGGRGVEVD